MDTVYSVKRFVSRGGQHSFYINLSNHGGSFCRRPKTGGGHEWVGGRAPSDDALNQAGALVASTVAVPEGKAAWTMWTALPANCTVYAPRPSRRPSGDGEWLNGRWMD